MKEAFLQKSLQGKILKVLILVLIGVFTMQLTNSSPPIYNPLEPIGIEKNSTFFDLFNSPNQEYFDFYVNESGLLISNYPDRLIAQQKICFELNSINYCLNELPLAWKNQTDNLTYAWINGTYSTAVLDFQLKYSLNQTEEKIKIDLLSKNKFILAQKINISYNHFNLSLDNSNGSDTFVWIDEQRYNLTINQTISNITAKELRIYGTGENPFIYMSWNDTAVVEIKGKEVYLKFINLQIAPNQEMTKTIFWIDPISSVTLNDPTTNIAIYSSKWFWMNCTVAKSGQADTADSLWFEHNNTANTMRIIPVNATSSTLNTTSTNPIDPFTYADMFSINVSTPNANNYQIMCRANNSAGTEKTSVVRKVTVLQTNVTFNMSSLNLGSTGQNSQPLMKSSLVFSNGTNNNAMVYCLTGNCATITSNFSTVALLDNGTQTAFFNCSTGSLGFFSANFTVNSTEYQNSTTSDTKQMNVSCTITNQTHCGGSYNETDMTDWNITTDVKCVNEIIQVDGNITVSTGGNLTLINSTINYTNPVNNNSYILSVYPLSNGLWVYDSDNDKSTTNDRSVITSSNNNYINVTIKDDVDIINSRLNRLGRTATNFKITGDNVTKVNILGNIIENSFLSIDSSANPIPRNISFNNFTSGILLESPYFTVKNNNIKCLDAVSNGCVQLLYYFGTIFNNTVDCNNLSDGFKLSGYSDDRNLTSDTISNCKIAYNFDSLNHVIFINETILSSNQHIYLRNTSSLWVSNITFLNVSGITENLTSIGANPSSNENAFFIQYFLDVQAIDNTTGTAINNTNITVYDRYSNLVKTIQTDSNGLTTLFVVTDYKKNNTVSTQNFTTSFNVHNITASVSDYNFNSTTSNVTDSRRATISLWLLPVTTKPDIKIVNPSNNSVLASGTKVYSNYTYSTDVNRIWYELDSNNTNITITAGSNLTFNSLNEIIHNISVFANDSSNNINSSFINFSINRVIPTAFSISKNATSILTGTQVNFSANWTDNTALSGYIFTWNNSGSWLNASFTLFNGAYVSQNISNVTASGNSYVCWKFFANDTSDNWNMTMSNQCFTVSALTSYCSGNFNNSKAVFNITSNVECANETMDIDGNITVSTGGNLTFKNITLRFTGATLDGYNYINKTKDGGLWIYDNDNNRSTSNDASNITSNDATLEYDFWVFGNGARDNFTMKNSIIRNAGYLGGSSGIRLYNVSNVTFSGNNITDGNNYGLYLQYSSNNNITGNTINTTSSLGAGAAYGVYLISSSISNNIKNNTITTNAGGGGVAQENNHGIYLTTSSNNNTLQGNTITTNSGSTLLGSFGIYLSTISNIVQSNTITTSRTFGRGIYLDASSNTLSGNTITTSGSSGYGIYLSSGSNIVQSNTITTSGSSGYGIRLDANSNTLSSNTITTSNTNGYGIYLSSSSNSNISSNIITTNDTSSYGIYLLTSDFNNLSLNTINSSSSDSIFLNTGSDNNTIQSNTIKFSKYSGIRIQNTTSGIMPSNNTIINNNITNATNGISIFMNSTRPFNVNHTIENNNITFTASAIYISNSSNINISLGTIRNSTNGIFLFNSKQINSTNITFISNTYDFNITNSSSLTSINNTFNKTVKVLDNSNFTIMWFAEVYITDNQSNTNVSVWNTTGIKHGNSTTNAQGLTPLFLLTEYIRNNTNNLTSNNPFNFTASNTTFFNSTSINVDRSMRVKIGFKAPPPTAVAVEIKRWEAIDWIQDLGENIYNVSNHIFNPIRWLFAKIREVIEWIF